jgi:DNA-binding MarR family transcriptional regulator
LDGITEEVGYLLKEVQQDLRKRMDRALVELNLTTPQYSVLSELHEFPGLSNADLARKSFVTPQTMNLIVQNMEARKLIRRSPSTNNGKIMTTKVTSSGEALLNKANELVLKVQKEIFSRITAAENLVLSEILRKLRQGST